MAFPATVYRVFIASPDLPKERRTVEDAIMEWNADHAFDMQLVLLPVRWETHATPQAGIRPQDAINIDLVDKCDILVAMFGTTVGTRKVNAKPGTVEEIDRFVAAGKTAMIYFSKRKVDPNTIDPTQLQELTDFKADTYTNALCGDIKSLANFKTTVARHLLRTVRKIHAAQPATSALPAPAPSADPEEDLRKAEAERGAFEELLLAKKFRRFKASRSVFALTIVPTTPTKDKIEYGPTHEMSLRSMFKPFRASLGSFQPLARSIYSENPPPDPLHGSGDRGPQSALEVTNRGTIYAADAWDWWDDDTTRVSAYRMNVFQVEIIKSICSYVDSLRKLGVTSSVWIGMSMLRFGEFSFRFHDRHETPLRPLNVHHGVEDIRADMVEIPADLTADFKSFATALKPAFLTFWRACNYNVVASYDEDGNYHGAA